MIFGSAPSVLDRWWSSRDSRLPRCNFVLHRWSPLPHETTLCINNILRASSRSVVVRLIAEQICSSRFLSGSLCHISSQKLRSQRAERSTALRATVPALPDANPSLHSICIGPASAARAASFKRLNRTRAEHRACLHVFVKTRVRLSTSVSGQFPDCRSGSYLVERLEIENGALGFAINSHGSGKRCAHAASHAFS
jgi:hypothetical protein